MARRINATRAEVGFMFEMPRAGRWRFWRRVTNRYICFQALLKAVQICQRKNSWKFHQDWRVPRIIMEKLSICQIPPLFLA
jgi:hypothetical protein